ncbi:hypothetical protein NL108_002482 [Boleophthalmus pectinirostris]|nr:hypothetical protein NL108_002482 [Boleophthalmus pectinirostris]
MESNLLAMTIISGLLNPLNIIVNVFYVFCLSFPPQTGQKKQPLTMLLGFLILCLLSYCVSLTIQGLLELAKEYSMIVVICELITGFTVDCSMVGYVWLNFYYYIQIVPAQSALFHWVKRNIKSTIYVLLGTDILITMLTRIFYVVFMYLINEIVHHSSDSFFNMTIWGGLEESYAFSFYMTLLHYAVMLCVTVLSSFSTVCYLHKHMKNLGKMGTSFSATRLRSQMRVTITGIFQGVLFFLFASYALCEVFVAEYSGKYIDKYIWFSISTFFISGTTVTLGIGQNVFRQRIIDMYKALKHVSICQKTE